MTDSSYESTSLRPLSVSLSLSLSLSLALSLTSGSAMTLAPIAPCAQNKLECKQNIQLRRKVVIRFKLIRTKSESARIGSIRGGNIGVILLEPQQPQRNVSEFSCNLMTTGGRCVDGFFFEWPRPYEPKWTWVAVHVKFDPCSGRGSSSE